MHNTPKEDYKEMLQGLSRRSLVFAYCTTVKVVAQAAKDKRNEELVAAILAVKFGK